MPRTSTAVLYDGDDFDNLTDLRLAYELAQERATAGALRSTLAADAPGVDGARDAYLAAVDEAAARATEVIVQDIGAKRWRELAKDHPPRPGNQYDEMAGYNTDTFGETLLKFDDGERRTVVAPAFDKKSDRDEWLDNMPLADFEAVLTEALKVNRGQLADPKDVRSLSDRHS